jgi:hypothetical protein
VVLDNVSNVNVTVGQIFIAATAYAPGNNTTAFNGTGGQNLPMMDHYSRIQQSALSNTLGINRTLVRSTNHQCRLFSE